MVDLDAVRAQYSRLCAERGGWNDTPKGFLAYLKTLQGGRRDLWRKPSYPITMAHADNRNKTKAAP